MQILNDTILKDKYDVIVVGAGIGGITAGSLLAKKGLSVLLIEQHYLPGGVCTTVKRNGVSMDAGAALLFGWDTKVKGSPHVFVMNELEEEIDMINHEALYRMHFSGGRMVTFWKDFDRYFKELCVAFPGKEDQFKGFYDEAFRIYTSITSNVMVGTPDTMGKMDGLKMMIKNPKSVISMPKMMNSSLKDTLYKYVKDKEVEGLFDLLIASCYCTTIEETPLMLAAAIVCNTHDSGAYYPAGSPQMFPNKMEKAFEKYGGQILYRNLVDEILIENNTAVGVKLDNGTIIKSKTVVSNATIWNLYGKLIKPENTTPEKIEWAQSFIPSFGACVLYIGVKKDVIPEGTSSIEAFVNVRDLDAENYFMYIPSVDDPSICPEDMHSVSILCSAGDYNWPRPWEEGYQGEEYAKEKQKIADLALKKIEEHFPGFRKNIVTMEIGTPSTIERFTVRNHGCIGGPKQALGQHLLKRLKAKSEYKNLYCVGDSTVMGEGVVSVTSSAIGASNMLLKDLKMDQYKIRKYDKCYVNDVKGKPLAPLPALGVKLDESKAKRLANDCQWCEDPKCMTKCPAGIDVPN
ncbi:MAG: FAD-dependent oxidoreductase, partial [archaeon]|nr:FAD-dependent oxidoreductase [archaeon]